MVVFLCVFFADIIHLDVHYVCYTMLVQRFEPQDRRFTNYYYYCYCYYYYYYVFDVNITEIIRLT